MKKLKSKIKNIIEQEKPSFGEWYRENEQRVQESLSNTKKQSMKEVKLWHITRWAVACTCVLLVLCISLPFVLKAHEEPPTYGSSDVGSVQIEEDKCYQYLKKMGFNFSLEFLNGNEMYTYETNELVFANIGGEYEVQGGDYYLLEFKFHIDKRYEFIEKEAYESLTEKVVVGDYTIYYGESTPGTLSVKYLLKIEYQGNVCYADIECFEHSFDDLVALLMGTLS